MCWISTIKRGALPLLPQPGHGAIFCHSFSQTVCLTLRSRSQIYNSLVKYHIMLIHTQLTLTRPLQQHAFCFPWADIDTIHIQFTIRLAHPILIVLLLFSLMDELMINNCRWNIIRNSHWYRRKVLKCAVVAMSAAVPRARWRPRSALCQLCWRCFPRTKADTLTGADTEILGHTVKIGVRDCDCGDCGVFCCRGSESWFVGECECSLLKCWATWGGWRLVSGDSFIMVIVQCKLFIISALNLYIVIFRVFCYPLLQ